jgi:hypothetical protein
VESLTHPQPPPNSIFFPGVLAEHGLTTMGWEIYGANYLDAVKTLKYRECFALAIPGLNVKTCSSDVILMIHWLPNQTLEARSTKFLGFMHKRKILSRKALKRLIVMTKAILQPAIWHQIYCKALNFQGKCAEIQSSEMSWSERPVVLELTMLCGHLAICWEGRSFVKCVYG